MYSPARSASLLSPLGRRLFSSYRDQDVVILSAVRTPIGSFQGSLSSLSAVDLGVQASKEALSRAKLAPSQVSEVILGNVVGAGLGQTPATQVAFKAGLPHSVPSTNVNKVCSSGLKTVMLGAQSIQTCQSEVVLAGGFESMSNIPHYLLKSRSGYGMGHGQLVDGLLKDGLTDAFDDVPMGMFGESCSEQFGFTREQQDQYALESYRRASEAAKQGKFKQEIVPIKIKNRKGEETIVSEDEEPGRLQPAKVASLRPAFKNGGTVTAANASKVSDGASAIIIASGAFARANGLTPLARLVGYADAQRKPSEFPIAPALAIPRSLKFAGLQLKDIDFFEINEAFSNVAMANMKLMDIEHAKLNVNGGAVALGHPIGASGGRILVTLIHVLKQRGGKYGVAAICNGGGGSSSVVIENL